MPRPRVPPPPGERSVFHGKRLADYQGRTYIWPPTDVKPGEHKCYLPKKLMHTYVGHTKGVNRVRFFPTYGHILLSASMDTTIKIWDMRNDHERQCLRTMYGHTQAVREVAFNSDGKTFLSCGYDKVVRHWDTETGACLARLNNGVHLVLRAVLSARRELVLAGGADNYIYQWDMRANEVVQTYTEHQGAVNTVTFFDQNRRFMSTSDDKKIFLWEFGIPVVIRHISDPEMHAAPAVAMHPSGEFAACQNLNNVITVYESRRHHAQEEQDVQGPHGRRLRVRRRLLARRPVPRSRATATASASSGTGRRHRSTPSSSATRASPSRASGIRSSRAKSPRPAGMEKFNSGIDPVFCVAWVLFLFAFIMFSSAHAPQPRASACAARLRSPCSFVEKEES
jgi:WD40 repeat protein